MKTLITIVVLISLLHFGSCLKENETKKQSCRIGTISETTQRGTNVTLFTYNSDGKVATIDVLEGNSESTHKLFTYSGNTIIVDITRTNGASVTPSRDSITTDDKGRALNIRHYHSNGRRWTNNHVVYNGDELLRVEVTTESSLVPEVSIPTYVNGNMVSTTAPWGNATLEYYTDKALQQGDYLEISNLLGYGISVGPNKNLVKSTTIGGNKLNFQYEFNSQGLITKVSVIDRTPVTTLTYHYICD